MVIDGRHNVLCCELGVTADRVWLIRFCLLVIENELVLSSRFELLTSPLPREVVLTEVTREKLVPKGV